MDDAFLDSALRLGRAVDAGELSLAAACERLGAQASAEGATGAAVLRLFRRAFTACEEAPSAALTLGQLGAAAVRSLAVAEIDLGAAIGRVDAPALAWFLRAWLAVNAGRPDLAEEDMAAMIDASDRGRDRLDATLLIAVGWERARGFGDAANAYFAAARQVAAIFESERLRDEGVFGRARAALRDVLEIPEVWSLAGALPVLHAVLLTRAAQCCVLADEAATGVRLAWQAAALLKAGAGEHAAGIERRVALNTLSVAHAKAGAPEAAAAAAEESYALAEAAGDLRSQLDAAGLVARHHAQRGDAGGASTWAARAQALRRSLGATISAATELRVTAPMRYIAAVTARDLSICLFGLVEADGGERAPGARSLLVVAEEAARSLRAFADRSVALHERWRRSEADAGALVGGAAELGELAGGLEVALERGGVARALAEEALAHPEDLGVAWEVAIWLSVAVHLLAELAELEAAARRALVDGAVSERGWAAEILTAAGLLAKLAALPTKTSAAAESGDAEEVGKALGSFFTVYAMKALEAAKRAVAMGPEVSGAAALDAADFVEIALASQTRRFAGVFLGSDDAEVERALRAATRGREARVFVGASRSSSFASDRRQRWRDLGASAALHAFVTASAAEGDGGEALAAWGILRALGRDGGGVDRVFCVAGAPLPAWAASRRELVGAWIEPALREVETLEEAIAESLACADRLGGVRPAFAGKRAPE